MKVRKQHLGPFCKDTDINKPHGKTPNREPFLPRVSMLHWKHSSLRYIDSKITTTHLLKYDIKMKNSSHFLSLCPPLFISILFLQEGPRERGRWCKLHPYIALLFTKGATNHYKHEAVHDRESKPPPREDIIRCEFKQSNLMDGQSQTNCNQEPELTPQF